MKGLKLVFFGKVQKVGFRLTMVAEARRLSIKGYVKNRKDGAVESVVFGESDKIYKLVESLRSKFNITDIVQSDIDESDSFTEDFNVIT